MAMSTFKESVYLAFAIAAIAVGITCAIAAVEYIVPGAFPLDKGGV